LEHDRDMAWHGRSPNWQDMVALAVLLVIIVLIGSGARKMLAPFFRAQHAGIALPQQPNSRFLCSHLMRVNAGMRPQPVLAA